MKFKLLIWLLPIVFLVACNQESEIEILESENEESVEDRVKCCYYINQLSVEWQAQQFVCRDGTTIPFSDEIWANYDLTKQEIYFGGNALGICGYANASFLEKRCETQMFGVEERRAIINGTVHDIIVFRHNGWYQQCFPNFKGEFFGIRHAYRVDDDCIHI